MSKLQDFIKQYPKAPRAIVWGGGVSLIALGTLWFFHSAKSYAPPPAAHKSRITTATDAISPKDLWINRIENKAEDMLHNVEEIKQENQSLKQQMDMMSSMVESLTKNNLTNRLKAQENLITNKDVIGESDDFLNQDALNDNDISSTTAVPNGHITKLPSSGFKVLSLAEQDLPKEKDRPKSVEELIPAGTYATGILTTGIAANTSLNAQSDPQPAMVRITDKGMLPRGFRSDIKEAVIIAACYGDISSERANCRLNNGLHLFSPL